MFIKNNVSYKRIDDGDVSPFAIRFGSHRMAQKTEVYTHCPWACGQQSQLGVPQSQGHCPVPWRAGDGEQAGKETFSPEARAGWGWEWLLTCQGPWAGLYRPRLGDSKVPAFSLLSLDSVVDRPCWRQWETNILSKSRSWSKLPDWLRFFFWRLFRWKEWTESSALAERSVESPMIISMRPLRKIISVMSMSKNSGVLLQTKSPDWLESVAMGSVLPLRIPVSPPAPRASGTLWY